MPRGVPRNGLKKTNYIKQPYIPEVVKEKKTVKSSLFLSQKQLEDYGLIGVQCICKNVFINKNLDDDKMN